MKETFIDANFRGATLDIIQLCNDTIEAFQAQGFKLTLRQLYYQLVSRNVIPNQERAYKNLGSTISKARLAGLVDWSAIEDRMRQPYKIGEWSDPDEIMRVVARQYRLQRWSTQAELVEVWCEKDALAGVLRPIVDEWNATLMVNRGYSSQSAMKEAAERIGRSGKPVHILYVGDLDPSGEDMVRDVFDRLSLLTRGNVDLDIVKLAITEAQVAEYNPPPNPAKMTDSRARGFVERFGHNSYEADALPPDVLARTVRDGIEQWVDRVAWETTLAREANDRRLLTAAAERIMDERE